MDNKTQQKIHDIMQTCDDYHEKYLKQEAIAALNHLKLIELSTGLDVEEKGRLRINVEIITKADAKLDDAWLYSEKYRTKLMLAWINRNNMNLGFLSL